MITTPIHGTLRDVLRTLKVALPLKVDDEGHAYVADALILRKGQASILVYDEEKQRLSTLEDAAIGTFEEFQTAFEAQLTDIA